MSQGNWSEWLGTPDGTSPLQRTPNYVALTDDTIKHSNSVIPALSNSTRPYGVPSYPQYNPTTPSTPHYGQHQYNTPYYQHQYHGSLAPPADYYATVRKQKHKNKNKKKKKRHHVSIGGSPPARPPKPPNIPSIAPTITTIASSKQYELIISNVPSQIRSRELHQALNAQKCHLTDFYIPDYNEPSTIIIIVKGFVQWRQLSKLTEIEIRGIKCDIKPKPLKSFSDNDQQNTNANATNTHNTQHTNDAHNTQQKEDENTVNTVHDVIITQVNKDTKQEQTADQPLENDAEITIKCQDESKETNDIIHIDNTDDNTHNVMDMVMKEEPHQAALTSCDEKPIIHTDTDDGDTKENTNSNDEDEDDKKDKDTDTDKSVVYDGLNVKLEVPDVPDIMMSDEDEEEEEEEEEDELEADTFFVEDNSHTITYSNLHELMEAEESMDEVIHKPDVLVIQNEIENDSVCIQSTVHVRTHPKKPSVSCTNVEKRLSLRTIAKNTKKRLCMNRKDTITPRKHTVSVFKNKGTKARNKEKYNMKLDKHKIPKITITRDIKCGINHDTRSMFMSKLVQLSCTYHHGMALLQFKSIVIKIEDIMKQECPTTTTYKLSCGPLLKRYRELKNIHQLLVYTQEEYGPKSKEIKAQTPLERLILTYEQLQENGYPLKTAYLEDEYADFVLAPKKQYTADKEIYDLLAIDCEMCKTTKGSELTRISIVDSKLMVVYDKLVKTEHEIIDYLTQWSGITPKLMKDVTRSIADVHRDIFAFIDSDTILCGHSLENDLIAMKMVHYKVVDTAVLYMKRHRFRNNKRNIGYSIGSGGGRKISLKNLCDQYLNKKIQSTKGPDGQIVGHSSVEDAIAAMQLLQLQLKWEEERNRKLGISNDNNDVDAIMENQNDIRKNKQQIKRKKYPKMLLKQKRFKVVCVENEEDDIDVLSLYGSNKKRTLDFSKQRFNPNINGNNNDNVLPMTSKEDMLNDLFEDDLFKPKQDTNVCTNAMDIDNESNYDSDSEDDAILLPQTKTILKPMEGTVGGQKKTIQMDRENGDCVVDIDKPKFRGIKRKLQLAPDDNDHGYKTAKKVKLSPSKLKTRTKRVRKPIANPTKIICDSHSDSESNYGSDSIHSIKSLSKSPSLSDVVYSCNYNNMPPLPPNVNVLDEADRHKRRKKHKDRKHKSTSKSKKRSISESCNDKESESKKRYEYQYIALDLDEGNNNDMDIRSSSRPKRKAKSKEKHFKSKAKSIILEWCHKYLNPLFKQQKITRKEYTAIAKKSVRKILESHEVWTAQNVKNLQRKSKHKVMDVIKGYVKKQTRS